MDLHFFMKDFSDSLLQANKKLALMSMGERYSRINWGNVQKLRDTCSKLEGQDPWKIEHKNFMILPQILPSDNKTANHYYSLCENLNLGSGFEQYIDVHGKDPQLLQPLLQLRDTISSLGFDPNNNYTTSQGLKPYFLIAFATGDGHTLKSLINHFNPYHLVIALADWQDFATSFWSIDWQELSHFQQNVRGGKLTIGCYNDGREILGYLTSQCLAGIDHSIVYLPPKSSCNPKAHEYRNQISKVELNHCITYLGYTIDEYNMVWNSWKTLSRCPRVFRRPHEPLGGSMIVCGSGPSLDSNLHLLRDLSQRFLIVACGSNFRTLKASGIRVDILALVERADEVLKDIKEVVDEYGSGETRLFMSSTCHHQLQDLFCETMIYFRPALTPLALFSNSPSEVLNFEGPESINTGVALAAAVGISDLVLVGVDLGSRSLNKIRSDKAVGCSVRDLTLEMNGNFGGKVFTSPSLRDSCMAVESCIRAYPSMKVFNASDGVYIDGAAPSSLDNLLADYSSLDSLSELSESSLGKWWANSQLYSRKRFDSSWLSRRPRAEIASLINDLRILFHSQETWNPYIIRRVTELLSLDVPLSSQFPRRVLRSTIHKLTVAVNRQIMVMASEPDKISAFETAARTTIIELLDLIERELYSMCDAVENLSTT